jgi:hypothetical protein
MVVSLVGVVRVLALSPGGTGVSEGAFVFLLSLLGVAPAKAAPAALALLGVQTSMSLLGGLLLLSRSLFGVGQLVGSASGDRDAPERLQLPMISPDSQEVKRHAA